MENLDKLVNELRKLPTETQWLEFKHNNYTPDMIGRDISALANSAWCNSFCKTPVRVSKTIKKSCSGSSISGKQSTLNA